jgi:hypothetical protein
VDLASEPLTLGATTCTGTPKSEKLNVLVDVVGAAVTRRIEEGELPDVRRDVGAKLLTLCCDSRACRSRPSLSIHTVVGPSCS